MVRASEVINTRESRKPYILFLKIKNEMEISKAALQYTLSCFSTSAKVSAELLKSAVDFWMEGKCSYFMNIQRRNWKKEETLEDNRNNWNIWSPPWLHFFTHQILPRWHQLVPSEPLEKPLRNLWVTSRCLVLHAVLSGLTISVECPVHLEQNWRAWDLCKVETQVQRDVSPCVHQDVVGRTSQEWGSSHNRLRPTHLSRPLSSHYKQV